MCTVIVPCKLRGLMPWFLQCMHVCDVLATADRRIVAMKTLQVGLWRRACSTRHDTRSRSKRIPFRAPYCRQEGAVLYDERAYFAPLHSLRAPPPQQAPVPPACTISNVRGRALWAVWQEGSSVFRSLGSTDSFPTSAAGLRSAMPICRVCSHFLILPLTADQGVLRT